MMKWFVKSKVENQTFWVFFKRCDKRRREKSLEIVEHQIEWWWSFTSPSGSSQYFRIGTKRDDKKLLLNCHDTILRFLFMAQVMERSTRPNTTLTAYTSAGFYGDRITLILKKSQFSAFLTFFGGLLSFLLYHKLMFWSPSSVCSTFF